MIDDDLAELKKIAKPVADLHPVSPIVITEPCVIVPGLTSREYFAGLAMQGYCANDTNVKTFRILAADAVKMADALCAELDRTNPT